jgi:hypothetical protein
MPDRGRCANHAAQLGIVRVYDGASGCATSSFLALPCCPPKTNTGSSQAIGVAGAKRANSTTPQG